MINKEKKKLIQISLTRDTFNWLNDYLSKENEKAIKPTTKSELIEALLIAWRIHAVSLPNEAQKESLEDKEKLN